jgi:hypothetical protein
MIIKITLDSTTTRDMTVTYEGTIAWPDGRFITGSTNMDEGPDVSENTSGLDDDDAGSLLDHALACAGDVTEPGDTAEVDEEELKRDAGL